jgi:hypothetical protein
LRDPGANDPSGRFTGLEKSGSGPPPQVGSKPPNHVGVDSGIEKLFEKKSVGHCVKGLRG